MKTNKILIAFSLLLSLSPKAFCIGVFYDSTTFNVVCKGAQDAKQYLEQNPNLSVIFIKDEDPILKNAVENLKYDPKTVMVVLKDAATIQSIQSQKRKQEIYMEVNALKQQNFQALQARTEGFDVTEETTTIRTRINALKAEYQALP